MSSMIRWINLGVNTKMRGGAAAPSWAPTDVANLFVWYKSDAGVLTDVDGVYQWDDQSASGFNLTQSTGSKKPQKVDSVLASKPAIRFDGVDDLMTASLSSVSTTAMSVFAVLKVAHIITHQRHVVLFSSSGNTDYIPNDTWIPLVRNVTNDIVGAFGGNAWMGLSGTGFSGAAKYVSSLLRGTDHVMRVNGVAGTPVSESQGTIISNLLVVGAGEDKTAYAKFSDMDVFELFAYKANITGTDLTDAENYMATRWGL